MFLACLQKLKIVFLDAAAAPAEIDLKLCVHAASCIEELTLSYIGSRKKCVSVFLGKKDISLNCRDVTVLSVKKPQDLTSVKYDNM